MDATCTIQDSIHVFSLVHKYVSRILGTYQFNLTGGRFLLHKTGKRMDACIQIHLPVVRTWSTKCGMFVCEIE